MNGALINAYIEDLDLINENESSKNMKIDIKNSEYSDDDELTAENSITISEDNYDEDGWSDKVQLACRQLLDDFDGFAYEIKNCTRGSYTNCKTGLELAEYLRNLLPSIEEVIESIETLEK